MSAPSYADSPRSVTNYLGQSYRFTPTYIRKRNPTTADIRPKENQGYYPIGSLWVNVSTPPEIWILAAIKSSSGQTVADWVLIANSLITGPVLSLSDNAGLVVPPSSDVSNPPGNIQLVAGAGITIVGTPASNLLTITNTGTMSSFAPDTGTNPVSGATVTLTNTTILAAGTLTNAIRSNGTGVSTLAYQLQYAGSNPAVSAASNWGVAQFDSNQFNVTSGFVQLLDSVISGSTTTNGAVTGNVLTFALGATAGTYTFDCKISAFCSTANGGPLSAGYTIVGSVRTTGGAAVLIPGQAVDNFEEGALSAGTAQLTVSANSAVFQVLGTAGKTIKWNAITSYLFSTEP